MSRGTASAGVWGRDDARELGPREGLGASAAGAGAAPSESPAKVARCGGSGVRGGVGCAVVSETETRIECITGARAAADGASMGAALVRVACGAAGLALSSSLFEYVDLWSSRTSWGGRDPPVAGDSVSIPTGRRIVLDVSPPPLERCGQTGACGGGGGGG